MIRPGAVVKQQPFWSLLGDGLFDEFDQVVGEALGEDRGADLAVLGCLEPGRSAGRLFDGAANVHDSGRFELDVLRLERHELAPAQPGPVGEAHGDRPPHHETTSSGSTAR
jgi:hypothetical protein